MDRKKFFRNILGASAAVTIGKYLPVPKEVVTPMLTTKGVQAIYPGIGNQAFKVVFAKGWFRKHDILRTSTEEYYVAEEHEDKLVCLNTLKPNAPNLEIYFGPKPSTDELLKVASTIPEYEPDKERQPHRGDR